MTIWSQIKGFVRAFRRYEPAPTARHRGHRLARTIKHGTALIGGTTNASLGNVGHQRREDLMVEAADRYDASFEDD